MNHVPGAMVAPALAAAVAMAAAGRSRPDEPSRAADGDSGGSVVSGFSRTTILLARETRSGLVVSFARRVGIVALFLLAAGLGIASGVLFAYAGDLPRISALDDYAPSTISRVYGARGEVVGEFAIERREVVPYEQISPFLEQAILAAEDDGFYQHVGLSIPRIVVTLIKDIVQRRMHGASTLTQQLTRKLFLTDDKTPERKIKEAILAIQIEKRYTKREIFTLYCNQMYFGHGVYGVEAASRLYFGKSAKDVSIEEAALIAGILQGNVRQSPYVNIATRRCGGATTRSARMADVGYITAAAGRGIEEEADRGPTPTLQDRHRPRRRISSKKCARELESRYGAKQLYENGLSIQTAHRPAAPGSRITGAERGAAAHRQAARLPQAADETSSPKGTRSRPSGSRAGSGRCPPDESFPPSSPALTPRRSSCASDRRESRIDRKGFGWLGQDGADAGPDTRRSRRDAAPAHRPTARHRRRVRSSRPPRSRAPCSSSTTSTGQILTMVGGYSFERSKFNRATQANRQVGSAFKPIVYTAAIDSGYTPVTVLMDTPVSFPGGAGQPPYAPLNYDREFEGPITLRRALEQSRNVPAVRVMDQLGPNQVITYARRLGLESPLPPYLAVALGAAEATLHGDDQRLFGFPEPGRAHAPVLGPEGHRSRRQRPRGEPARAEGRDSRRHRVRDDQPPARRRPARYRRRRPRR